MAVLAWMGCVKTVEPIADQFSVNVEYKATSGKTYLTQDVILNPKDSVFLDFTVTAQEDMAVIEIQKNGTKLDTFRVSTLAPRSFSGTKGYKLDSIVGVSSFRVLARNAKGQFIGDGKKLITVTTMPDFRYYRQRQLSVPDSTAKTNPSFFSTATGDKFSFSDVVTKTNSAAIDFGYFYDTTTASAPKHTIYALTNSTVFAPHDLSTWTKNGTIFKKITSPAFTAILNAGEIVKAGITNLASGTVTKCPQLVTGAMYVFKTAGGKYGVFYVNFTNQDKATKDTWINIDVKMQN